MAKPKLALIPASQGSKVFSVLPSSGVGDFDFSRSGKATRINSQGLIEEVANGQSRLEYPLIDGVVSGCPSLLLEPQRTNLIPYSEYISSWSATGAVVTENYAISPEGVLNATRLVGTGNDFIRQDNIIANPSNKTFTSSFWAKNNGGDAKISVQMNSSGVATYAKGIVLTNEWQRFDFTQSYSGTDTGSLTFRFRQTNSIDCLVYGFQLEEGSYPTSYIPTNGAVVTRAAETATGSGDATTFNDSEGVLMAEISALNESQAVTTLSISDNSLSNRVLIVLTSGEIRGQFVSSGNNISRDSSGIIIENFNKIACRYTSNTFKVFVNGYQVGSTATITFPLSGITELSFDRGDGVLDFEGKTKQLQYYNSALTDSELEILTSWVSFTEMAQGQLYTIE